MSNNSELDLQNKSYEFLSESIKSAMKNGLPPEDLGRLLRDASREDLELFSISLIGSPEVDIKTLRRAGSSLSSDETKE